MTGLSTLATSTFSKSPVPLVIWLFSHQLCLRSPGTSYCPKGVIFQLLSSLTALLTILSPLRLSLTFHDIAPSSLSVFPLLLLSSPCSLKWRYSSSFIPPSSDLSSYLLLRKPIKSQECQDLGHLMFQPTLHVLSPYSLGQLFPSNISNITCMLRNLIFKSLIVDLS